MAAEGFLGKHTLSGERAATADHPAVLHHLPLSASAKTKAIPIGTVMKRVEGEDGKAAWEPFLSTDEAAPVAVVDDVCEAGAGSALCLVHGGVKLRMLKTGDNKELTDLQIALLAESGIYAV